MSHLLNIDLIILFFLLGVLASWLKSDLEIPEPISKFLSIFLLLSLGLKGGHEVRFAENLSAFGTILSIGLLSCLIFPIFIFYWLKNKLGPSNAAALSACYGSVSAVTLIAAQGFLANEAIPFSGYIVAVMALMEIPAIVIGLYLYHRAKNFNERIESATPILSAKSVILLLGGFGIGFVMSDASWTSIAPVVQDSFKGVLAFFLLDLGIAAQRQLAKAWQHRILALAVGCVLPLAQGCLVLGISSFFEMPSGDRILLAVLAGSSSYIAAPAAVRTAIPEANPSFYVALPLALTFPMNVTLGIPIYTELSFYLGN